MNRVTIGINDALLFSNTIVAFLLVYGLFHETLPSHPYIDKNTLYLGLVLTLQTYGALLLERRNNDPFVLLLTCILIFFYELRIFTLLIYPVQDVFERYTYNPVDSNYALLYIILANLFLYAGFYKVKFRVNGEINVKKYKSKPPWIVVIVLIISIILGLLIYEIPELDKSVIHLVYQNFLTPNIILIILSVYVILFRKSISPIYINIIIISAMFLVLLQTLSFSRSGIITLLENVFIIWVAVLMGVRLSIKSSIKWFILLAFLIFLQFHIYSVSTASRMIKGNNGVLVAEKVDMFVKSSENHNANEVNIGKALARAGDFDYSAELIANKDTYAKVFTVENYIKSIIDNVLTPGFDVYDQVKISSLLKYTYSENLTVISKLKDSRDSYHTDQFGLYGEMYNLFGFMSLVVYYLIALLLKLAYIYEGKFNPFIIGLKRVLLLYIFYYWMKSFGFDSILLKAIILTVSFYGLSKLFYSKSVIVEYES